MAHNSVLPDEHDPRLEQKISSLLAGGLSARSVLARELHVDEDVIEGYCDRLVDVEALELTELDCKLLSTLAQNGTAAMSTTSLATEIGEDRKHVYERCRRLELENPQ